MNITDAQSERWLNQSYTPREDWLLHKHFFCINRIQNWGKDKPERNKLIVQHFHKIPMRKKAKGYLWRIMVMNEIVKPN